MHVIQARNVHEALPKAVAFMLQAGVERRSRNGLVLQSVLPVTTVYEKPLERVIFHHERDANPFFHLYESIWMLLGRNDVAPLLRYVKNFARYSNDGTTLNGAYGYRWRFHFGFDQLDVIARRLSENPDDRRCTLTMTDPRADLNFSDENKDVPCNTIATFQRHPISGALEMTVFNRSNDIVWGAYGANAVHFAFLQEYVAALIGCDVGVYRQVSVNWHAYVESFEQVRQLGLDERGLYSVAQVPQSPYRRGVIALPLLEPGYEARHAHLDLRWLDYEVNNGFVGSYPPSSVSAFARNAEIVLRAHHLYSMHSAPRKFGIAREVLSEGDERVDWIQAATEWIVRRETAWREKHS